MKISISVNGRFHSYDVAYELYKKGFLNQLITTYPYFKIKEWGIPSQLVDTNIKLGIFDRVIRLMPNILKFKLMVIQKKLYEKFACKSLKIDSDVLLCWSGDSVKIIDYAKKNNILVILERSSIHIEKQLEIIENEHKKNKKKYYQIDQKLIHRELLGYEKTNIIMVPSTYVRDSFDNEELKKKIFINKLCVNLGLFYKKNQIKDKSKLKIIYVGAISLQKGVHYLIEAVNELLCEGIKLELNLIGKIDYELRSFMKKFYSKNIILTGYIPRHKLVDFYNSSHLFVMPSIQDGMATVQLEALACGLPIISTKSSGGEDLIQNGKTGFIINSGNISELKEKILFFYEDRVALEQMSINAQNLSNNEFRWSNYVERLLKKIVLFQEL